MNISTQACWMVKMILAGRGTLVQVHTEIKPGHSVIRQIYLLLLGVTSKMAQKCLMFQKKARLKAVLTMWLHLYGRFLAADSLLKWGRVVEPICVLCSERDEIKEHLLFSCHYTIQIWTRIFTQLEWNGQSWRSWDQHIEWTIAHAKRKSQKASLFRIVFAEVIHAVWIERNLRIVK